MAYTTRKHAKSNTRAKMIMLIVALVAVVVLALYLTSR